MWKTLVIIATVVLGTQTTVEAEAVAGGACQTSGNEVVWDYAGDPNADFADAPKAVQNGMNRHAQNQRRPGRRPGHADLARLLGGGGQLGVPGRQDVLPVRPHLRDVGVRLRER